MKKYMKLWDFLEVFCHLHSKYQKQPHSVIYFLKDTVEGYLNLYNRYASLFTYLKNCKKKVAHKFSFLSFLADYTKQCI